MLLTPLLLVLSFSGDAFGTNTPFKALRSGDFLSLSKEERLRLTALHVAGRGIPFDKGGVPGCWDIPECGWTSIDEYVKQDMNPKRIRAVGAKRIRTSSPRQAAAALDAESPNGAAAESPERGSCSGSSTPTSAMVGRKNGRCKSEPSQVWERKPLRVTQWTAIRWRQLPSLLLRPWLGLQHKLKHPRGPPRRKHRWWWVPIMPSLSD